MHRKLTSFIFAAAAITLPAAAAELRVHLPPDSTVITFELKATMHTVHGSARLESADFTIDSESGVASGEAVVAAASAETGNTKRDKKMHSKVLLSSEQPRIAIRAERIEGLLPNRGHSIGRSAP